MQFRLCGGVSPILAPVCGEEVHKESLIRIRRVGLNDVTLDIQVVLGVALPVMLVHPVGAIPGIAGRAIGANPRGDLLRQIDDETVAVAIFVHRRGRIVYIPVVPSGVINGAHAVVRVSFDEFGVAGVAGLPDALAGIEAVLLVMLHLVIGHATPTSRADHPRVDADATVARTSPVRDPRPSHRPGGSRNRYCHRSLSYTAPHQSPRNSLPRPVAPNPPRPRLPPPC